MTALLRLAFFALLVRPLVLVVLGMNIRHRDRLPENGPAILVANHNSHLDTLVLMSLFPLRLLPKLSPVAAADYFLRNKALAWFSRNIIGIIPISRRPPKKREPLLAEVTSVLHRNHIVILFPEGTRGEPERLAAFKTGVSHLARDHDEVPVTPLFLHGLGKTLPRGEILLVPFFCDIFVGEPIAWAGDRNAFMEELENTMAALAREGDFPPWD